MTIRSLQPRMGREVAARRLNPFGTLGAFRRWFSAPTSGIAEIYIPYRMYRITFHDRGMESSRYIAVDSAAGTLDPYEFPDLPEAEAWETLTSRNVHPALVDEGETRRIAIEKVRRQVFSRGFFRLTSPRISAELIEQEFYIPYWACFYGDKENLRIRVVDAVRQTREGNKLRQLIKNWLLESRKAASLSVSTSGENPA